MKLLAGNSNLPLANAISQYLEIPLTDANVRRFADEEIFVEMEVTATAFGRPRLAQD